MQRNHAIRNRRGMTLAELLVVVMIMVILLGIAIPLVKPALDDRKIREASREFNAFIRAAQARAAESGRNYGIWIERDALNPNLAYQIFYAETPPPYAGETQDASVATPLVPNSAPPPPLVPGTPVENVTLATTPYSTTPFQRYHPDVLKVVPWVERFPPPWLRRVYLSGAYSLEVQHREGDPDSKPLVNRGDIIRFSFTGPDYIIYDIYTTNSPLTSDNPTTPTIEPEQAGDLYAGEQPMLRPTPTGSTAVGIIIGPTLTDRHSWLNPPDPTTGPIYAGSRFQIARRPQRTAAGALTLPNGTGIILSLSGGEGVIRRNTSGALIDDFNEFRALPPTPDTSPVVLMFRPDGSVELVASSSGGTGIPTGPLYFLIGRADVDEDNPVTPTSPPPAIQDDLTWQALNDPNSLWVVVNDRTGAIATSQINEWAPAVAAMGLPPTAPLVSKTQAARGLARTGQSVGGN